MKFSGQNQQFWGQLVAPGDDTLGAFITYSRYDASGKLIGQATPGSDSLGSNWLQMASGGGEAGEIVVVTGIWAHVTNPGIAAPLVVQFGFSLVPGAPGPSRLVYRAVLGPLETLTYTPESGFCVYDNTGTLKSSGGATGGTPSTPAPYTVPFHADGSAALTLTSQTQAAAFLGNSNRNITQLDLAGYTECRVTARVATGSASVNNPRLWVGYSSAFTTTIGSFVDIGTSKVAASLTTAGVARSAWVPLAPAAIADAVHVTVVQDGGNGTLSPVLGPVVVEFR